MKFKVLFAMLIVFLLLTTYAILASCNHKKTVLNATDLPSGYYPGNTMDDKEKGFSAFTEYYTSMSPSTRNYYNKKYGSLIKAPPSSTIGVVRYYSDKGFTDEFIESEKGSTYHPGWIKTTPGGKVLGDKCYSLCRKYEDGSELIKVIIVKKRALCVISINNQKNSKSISKESAEKLIETIYSRL